MATISAWPPANGDSQTATPSSRRECTRCDLLRVKTASSLIHHVAPGNADGVTITAPSRSRVPQHDATALDIAYCSPEGAHSSPGTQRAARYRPAGQRHVHLLVAKANGRESDPLPSGDTAGNISIPVPTVTVRFPPPERLIDRR